MHVYKQLFNKFILRCLNAINLPISTVKHWSSKEIKQTIQKQNLSLYFSFILGPYQDQIQSQYHIIIGV